MSSTTVVRKGSDADAHPCESEPNGCDAQPEKPVNTAGARGWRRLVPEGFAGTVGGSFFAPPPWVDTSKVPGTTPQPETTANAPSFRNYVTGNFVVNSPNLVWLMIALCDYFIFPYDLEAAKVWSLHWVGFRLFANFVIAFGFAGFWHVTLYLLEWGTRPFNPRRQYKVSKVLHNMWYNALGVLQWTAWEAMYMHCCATGRLPYVSDADSFGSIWGLVQFVAIFFWVPLFRDFHFYFAHRFIHTKFLYKYVHSLHHRNTDVEPFAGLCMHPVEHLYYFSCAGLCFIIKASPFAFMWNGVHLMISPAAAHSGFEDNWQSDQYHYLHHRFFECNYSSPAVPYDIWFGTFRDTLDSNDKSYKGAAAESKSDKDDGKVGAAQADAKATLVGLPRWDEMTYNVTCYMFFPTLVACSALKMHGVDKLAVGGLVGNAHLLAAVMSLGPLLVAAVLLGVTSRRPFANPRFTFLYPFHREGVFGALGFHTFFSSLLCVVPVYTFFHMLLSEPGESLFFRFYGR